MWGMGKRRRPSGSAEQTERALFRELGAKHTSEGSGNRRSRGPRSSRARFAGLALVVLVAAVASLAVANRGESALSGTPLPSSAGMSGWDTVSDSWTPGNTVEYAEKQAIPFRIDLGGLSTSSTYLVNICREFQNGSKYGFLYLDEFDTTIHLTDAQAGGPVLDATGPFATVNATVTGVQDYTDAGGVCGSQERLVQVTVKPTSATTSYLLWGGHLAAPGDTVPGSANLVGFGNGAGSYPGASLAMRRVSPDKAVPIPVNKIIILSKIDVNKVVQGGTAVPGDFCFTISPNANGAPQVCGSGSFLDLPTGTYTVQESGPSAYTLQSVTGTNCAAVQPLTNRQASASVVATTKAPITASCTFTNVFQKQTPTLATTSSPTGGGVVPGASVTDGFTASGAFGTPSGSVDFFLCQPATVTANGGDCSSGGAKVGATKALSGGSATSDASANTTAVGTYCWRAEYSGDTVYSSGSHTNKTTECFTVGKKTPTLATTSSPTGGGVVPGASVTDGFTASGAFGTPSGSVDFFLCQPATVTANGGDCSSGGAKVGATKALSGGSATSDASANTTAVGTYCWRAEYSGDGLYSSGSHTNKTSECFTTVKQPSATATTSSPTGGGVLPGASVTDQATVSGSGPTATGSVDFFLCQPATVTANGGDCSSGGAKVGATKALSGGSATSDASANTTAVGTYCWRAEYSGDGFYNSSTHTNKTTECFTTVKQPSATATTSSPTGGGVLPGASVTDQATVSGSGPTATGSVDFFLCQPATVTANGGDCSSGGAKVGATKALSGGSATSDASANTTAVGTYCWRAEYSGDGFYNSSTHTNKTTECFTTVKKTSTIGDDVEPDWWRCASGCVRH